VLSRVIVSVNISPLRTWRFRSFSMLPVYVQATSIENNDNTARVNEYAPLQLVYDDVHAQFQLFPFSGICYEML
jgi:hypothetical protein